MVQTHPVQHRGLKCSSSFQPPINPDVFPMKFLKSSRKAAVSPLCTPLSPSPRVPAEGDFTWQGQAAPVPCDIFRGKFRSKQFPACSPAGTMPGILILRLLWSRRGTQLHAKGSSHGGEQSHPPVPQSRGCTAPSPTPSPTPQTAVSVSVPSLFDMP